jgi:hypothetical protein
MYVPEKHFNGFGLKNLALIVVAAVVLGALAWNQKPLRLASVNPASSLNATVADASGTHGQVLGAVEYNQQLVDQFAPIEVKISNDNSQQAFINYTDQVAAVQSGDNLSLLLNGNSLQRSKDGKDKFISDLKQIAAPSALKDYHKLLLAYYQLKFNAQDSLQADQVGVYAVAVQGQLDKLRENFKTSAEVVLP